MCPSHSFLECVLTQEGYTARPLLENAEVPFYVAPTIAPVMHSSAAPDYLEHPQSAFDYYQTFGTPSTPTLSPEKNQFFN